MRPMKNNSALEYKNKYNKDILSNPVNKNSMNKAPWIEYLYKIYYGPAHPASFVGPQKLQYFVQREGIYI